MSESESLETTAALAYDTYRTASGGTHDGGVPMPMWEQVSVPERDAWLAVAAAVTGTPASAPAAAPPAPSSPVLWTQADLEQMTATDLREMAQAQHLSVASSATKAQLIDALLAQQAARTTGGYA